jgi:hypothetical protein
MPRDILSEYGNDSNAPMAPRARSGGITQARDVMGYQPPRGPSNITDSKTPGLHGENLGNCGTQGPNSGGGRPSGSPGLGGDNSGNDGSQR